MKQFVVVTTAWITRGRRLTHYQVEADGMYVGEEQQGKVLAFSDEDDELVAVFADWDLAYLNGKVVVVNQVEETDVEGTGSDHKAIREAEAEVDNMP